MAEKKYTHNKYLNDAQKKKIVADYIETQNFVETAQMNGVTDMTVHRIVKKDYADVAKKLEQKKFENTQNTIEYMNTQHETKKRLLDKILRAIEGKVDNIDKFTTVRDLAMAYGVIVDKELKLLELQRGNANNDDLNVVKDLLGKLEKEAHDDFIR